MSKQTFVTYSPSLTPSLPFFCQHVKPVFFSPIFKASILNLPSPLPHANHASQVHAESSPSKLSSFPPLCLCSVYLCTWSALFPLHLLKLCSLSFHSSSRIFLFIKLSRPPRPPRLLCILIVPHYSVTTSQHHLELVRHTQAQAPFRLPTGSCISARFPGDHSTLTCERPWDLPAEPPLTFPHHLHGIAYFIALNCLIFKHDIILCSTQPLSKWICESTNKYNLNIYIIGN